MSDAPPRVLPAGLVALALGLIALAALGPLAGGPIHYPVTPTLRADIKFFGRYKAGWIRDGVILSVQRSPAPVMRASSGLWSCDSDEVIAAFDAER